jgi:hypothetical protein
LRAAGTGVHGEENSKETLAVITLPELRRCINNAIENVTEDMLERVWREWEYRLDICRVTRGVHIECI